MAEGVELRDVTPRDGLQALPAVPVATRVDLARRLAATGLRRVEVGSFVSERAVPQMAGTADVLAGLDDHGCRQEVLVVNTAGAARALASSADALLVVVAATDGFSRRNVRVDRAEALRTAVEAVALATQAGRPTIASVAVAFACPDEGAVPAGAVVAVAEQLVAAGAQEVLLSDTIGAATPPHVRATVAAVAGALPGTRLGLHLHDTRGMGLVNALAGLEAGVRLFDGSTGGFGGCPFAPRSTGNVATEELVHLFESLGLATGIDADALVEVARWLGHELGIDPPGRLARAGRLPARAVPS